MAQSRVTTESESAWRLRAELLSTRALLWVAGAGRWGEAKPEVHLYLYDRYWRLAMHYERQGRLSRAAVLRAKAEHHYRESGHDGPPFAAALAMPRPKMFRSVEAVSQSPGSDDNDAA
jgi:hypothetical protein